MAEVNFLSDCKKDSYVRYEKHKKTVNHLLLIAIIVISMSSPEYIESVFVLLYEANGVTTILYKTLTSSLITYPWLKTCLFIGQYSKKGFLNVAKMAPVLTGCFYLHFFLTPLFVGKLEILPSVTHFLHSSLRPINGNAEEIDALCSKKDAELREMKKIVCDTFHPINFTARCYTKGTGALSPPQYLTDDLFQLISGVVCTALITMTPVRIFVKILFWQFIFVTINLLLAIIFASVKVSTTSLANILLMTASVNRNGGSIFVSFVKFIPMFGWEMKNLACATPVFIMIGVYLPIDKKPSTTAMYGCFMQILILVLIFFAFVSDITTIAEYYNVSMDCVIADNDLFFENLVECRLQAAHIHHEDQGITGYSFVSFIDALMIRTTQFMYSTVHCFTFIFTLRSQYKFIAKHKWCRYSLAFLVCCATNTLAHAASLKDNAFDFYFSPISLVNFFFGATATLAVCTIYGVSTINTDNLFLYGNSLTPATRFLLTILPIDNLAFFFWRFNDFIQIKPWNIQVTEKFKKSNKVGYFAVCLSVLGIAALSILVVIIKAIAKGNISNAFFPDKKWGPWSPPGENKIKERQLFHPETAVRFEGDYYLCSHNCYLNSKVIEAEIMKSNLTFREIAAEIRSVDLNIVAPEIYYEYRHVLQLYQSKPCKKRK